MTYEEACRHARAMRQTADGAAFIDFIAHNLCGVGNKIGGNDDRADYKSIGAHNVGIELIDMTRERTTRKGQK